MRYTEPNGDSESMSHRGVSVLGMGDSRAKKTHADALSAYVQMRLDELYKAGVELSVLAVKWGLPKSAPGQVRSGDLGIRERTVSRYARMLGFSSEEALRTAAYEWWLAARKRGSPRELTFAMRAAKEELIRYRRATAMEIDAILEAYMHERFRTREVDWWLDTLTAELREERRKQPPPAPQSATGGLR